jgi:predicted ATPase
VALDRRPVRRVEADPEVSIDRDAWWARIPAIRALLADGLDLPAGVTFLVGENGSGKSTIVEALAHAYGLNVEGGSVYAMHATRPTESPLGKALRLVKAPYRAHAYFLRAETMHGLYTYLETATTAAGRSPDRYLHERSHGEGFLDLLADKFRGYGLFLMDEPEAPLSFTATLSLIVTLQDLASSGAQVVVATHSPMLTALPRATIIELGEHGMRPARWGNLDLVRNWQAFLDRPGAYIDRVLS